MGPQMLQDALARDRYARMLDTRVRLAQIRPCAETIRQARMEADAIIHHLCEDIRAAHGRVAADRFRSLWKEQRLWSDRVSGQRALIWSQNFHMANSIEEFGRLELTRRRQRQTLRQLRRLAQDPVAPDRRQPLALSPACLALGWPAGQ